MKISPNYAHHYNTGSVKKYDAPKPENVNFTSNEPKNKNRWVYLAFAVFVALPLMLLPVFKKLGESRKVTEEQRTYA